MLEFSCWLNDAIETKWQFSDDRFRAKSPFFGMAKLKMMTIMQKWLLLIIHEQRMEELRTTQHHTNP